LTPTPAVRAVPQASKAPALLATSNTEAIMSTAQPTPISIPTEPTVITVRRWEDPVVDTNGYPVNSAYTELFWLPILGPSATLALRRLAGYVTASASGVRVDLPQLGQSLGVGAGVGRHSILTRTLARLVSFHMAQWVGDVYEVRTIVAPLTVRHLHRLPQTLVVAHERWTQAQARRTA
jgi:hypothetical protein